MAARPRRPRTYPALTALIGVADAHWIRENDRGNPHADVGTSTIVAVKGAYDRGMPNWQAEMRQLALRHRLPIDDEAIFLTVLLVMSGIIFGPGDTSGEDVQILRNSQADLAAELRSSFPRLQTPRYTNAHLSRIIRLALELQPPPTRR